MAFYHGQRPHQDTIDLHRLLTDVQPSPLPWRLQVCKRDLTSDMQIRGTATLHLKLRARGPEGDVIEDSGSKRSKDEATKLDFGVIRNANLQSKHKQDTVSYAVVHTNLVSFVVCSYKSGLVKVSFTGKFLVFYNFFSLCNNIFCQSFSLEIY